MKEQEQLIRKKIVDDHDTNYFVEAGAGAGKTRMVVDRIISQLSSGNYKPSEIVAITFTNAAAKELQGRIITGLRLKADEGGTPGEYARKALSEVDQMCIGTIHSFCFKMLKERAFGAHLRPDLELYEEKEQLQEKEVFFDRWYVENAKELIDALEPYGWSGKKQLLGYFVQICELPSDVKVEYDEAIVNKLSETALLAAMKKAVSDISMVLNDPKCLAVIKNSSKAIPALFMDCIKNDDGYEEALGNFSTEKKTKGIFSTAAANKANAEAYAAIIWKLAKDISEIKRRYRSGVLMKYALKAREKYKLERSSKYISNDGLLQEARNLICRDTEDGIEDLKYFADKFKCIYVDEFQDTDHVQTQMILRLASVPEDASKLRKGALFVVGDPKQSIYRFRGADPEVYFSVKELFKEKEKCSVVSLPTNFRSCKDVIDWVNLNFKDRISGYTDMDVSDRQLETEEKLGELDDELSEKLLCGVYSMGSPAATTYSTKRGDKPDNVSIEAKAVSKIIRALVDNEYYVPDVSINSRYRRIEYRDFLVLVPGLDHMDIYMKEFGLNDIPVEVYGKIELAEDAVIDAFYRVYSYLASGYGDRPALERAVASLSCQGFDREKALLRLKDLKKNLKGKDAFALMVCLLNDPMIFIPFRETEIGKHKNEIEPSLRRLHQLFEIMISENVCDKQSVISRLHELISVPLEREMSLGENRNVIRFMNEHKAKGLEGKIVILARRTKQYIMQDSFRHRDVNNCYHFYCGSKNGINCYDADSKEAKADREATAAEQTRLEYVTATRAEQVFIFLDPIENGAQFCYSDDQYGRGSYSFGADAGVRVLTDTVVELTGDDKKDEQPGEGSAEDGGTGTDTKQL